MDAFSRSLCSKMNTVSMSVQHFLAVCVAKMSTIMPSVIDCCLLHNTAQLGFIFYCKCDETERGREGKKEDV